MSAALPFSSVAFSRSGVDFARNLDSIDEWSRIFDQTQHYHYFYQYAHSRGYTGSFRTSHAPSVGSVNSPLLQWQVSSVLSLGMLLHWFERIRVCIFI
jgi:hypothetical protein